MRLRGLGLGVALLLSTAATAQEPDALPTDRPGRFRIGPVYVTPSIRIESVGLDTNVFYTPDQRQSDVTASGGPGLNLVLPVKSSLRLTLDGYLGYLYFVRTESQRRLSGRAVAQVSWSGPRTQVAVQQAYSRSYGRPSFEVDRRVFQTVEETSASLSQRLFGRISLDLGGRRARQDLPEPEVYLGTDLRRSLGQDQYLARAGLRYALTVKTSVVAEGDHVADRFPLDPARDADSNRLMAGLRTDRTALISGQALAGIRSFRLRAPGAPETRLAVVDVDAMLNLSPRTRIGGSYARELAYSALATSDAPTLRTEVVGARIEKELVARLDLRLFGRRTRLRTDGPIVVRLPDGRQVVARREDTAREAGADLGYRFRTRLRIGVAATYTERRSSIAHFGIEGLLVGATVTFTP